MIQNTLTIQLHVSKKKRIENDLNEYFHEVEEFRSKSSFTRIKKSNKQKKKKKKRNQTAVRIC